MYYSVFFFSILEAWSMGIDCPNPSSPCPLGCVSYPGSEGCIDPAWNTTITEFCLSSFWGGGCLLGTWALWARWMLFSHHPPSPFPTSLSSRAVQDARRDGIMCRPRPRSRKRNLGNLGVKTSR
ncbi:hypothetical protein QBC42DRAFT_112582 [Cladorrhinum samala]|uniref:Uncharacterized protein n=1 Tax=Cladorrhinum samala TaxID=585594 RepID=A0AAV9HG59_9PEZI|nr:hypothetical protein QBC42DRAFT_112582 [Cladorrhinum samala]